MTSMRIFRIYQGEEHLQIGHLFFHALFGLQTPKIQPLELDYCIVQPPVIYDEMSNIPIQRNKKRTALSNSLCWKPEKGV